MRPRAQVRWLQLKVGLVIIAAVAGILVAIMNLNEGMGLFRQQATFRALVDDSHGKKVGAPRSEEHTSELQSLAYLVCRLLLEKKKRKPNTVAMNRELTHTMDMKRQCSRHEQ